MAEESKDINLLKRTKISVFVDEALPDILVVTYEFGVKIFKGVLLDSTKKNLPCGIQTLNPALKPPKPKPEDDALYAVNQRFAYGDPSTSKKRNVQISSKYKNSKMTVRLRPRQVLCSKCKGICNENSENVSRKRKPSAESVASAVLPAKRGVNAPITRSVSVHHANVELSDRRKLGEGSLVPKLTRLTQEEEMSATNGGSFKIFGGKLRKAVADKENEGEEKKSSSEQSEDSSNSDDAGEAVLSANGVGTRSGKRVLRKKRSVGSMEDLWDESVFEENANRNEQNPNQPINATKTIKISYGPQGEGTVLKIPAQQISKEDEKKPTEATEDDCTRNRAARKALKKAKKEARRKVFLSTTSGSSPMPRYTVGSASPRHGLGNNSPRYMYELSLPRRRKHKVKHKKRDKDRRHKEGEVSSTQDESKEQCLTQKLSINLKRLNDTYATYETSATAQQARNNEENSSSSDEQSEQVPDFPPPMLRINAQTLSSAPTADGSRMLVGDVVWGKIHGFPWWPGKVLTITNCGGQGPPQAHVAWYGSSTSSLMQCDQLSPYLENFKTRYNKKKRGPYKEAIKQATLEAKENAQQRMRQPLGNSPSHNIIPPALASPREIDVVS